jgi:hypothetical protein
MAGRGNTTVRLTEAPGVADALALQHRRGLEDVWGLEDVLRRPGLTARRGLEDVHGLADVSEDEPAAGVWAAAPETIPKAAPPAVNVYYDYDYYDYYHYYYYYYYYYY